MSRITLKKNSVVINSKENQSEKFLASLILGRLVWQKKFSISVETGFSLNLISVTKSYFLVFSSIFSKIWFENFPELSKRLQSLY